VCVCVCVLYTFSQFWMGSSDLRHKMITKVWPLATLQNSYEGVYAKIEHNILPICEMFHNFTQIRVGNVHFQF